MSWHFLVPEASVLQLLLRSVAVYVFLVVSLRLAGRRELGQLTSFDLVLLLILSNAVQNSINAGDNSLGGGLVSAAALLFLNALFGRAAFRWKGFERLVGGRPIPLVTDGRIHLGAMRKERITLEELRSALRKQGIQRVRDCKQVVLEPDGTLTAVRGDVEHRSLTEMAHSEERR